jgi:hypothetical protein
MSKLFGFDLLERQASDNALAEIESFIAGLRDSKWVESPIERLLAAVLILRVEMSRGHEYFTRVRWTSRDEWTAERTTVQSMLA